MAYNMRGTECYPVDLHFIKALFLAGQHRRCVQTCRDLINVAGDSLDDNLLNRSFVHFYLGLAHDEMARKMHPNSIARLPALQSAEQSFGAALEALPLRQDVTHWCKQHSRLSSIDSSQNAKDGGSPSLQSQSFTSYDPQESLASVSPPLSSPPSFHIRSPTGDVPLQDSPTSLEYDMEHDDNYAELLTPTRILHRTNSSMLASDREHHIMQLPRDQSKMSLLDIPPPQYGHTHSSATQQPRTTPTLPTHDRPSLLVPCDDRTTTKPQPSDTFQNSYPPSPVYVSPMSPSAYARRWSNASAVSTLSAISAPVAGNPIKHDSAYDASSLSDRLDEECRILRLVNQIDEWKQQLEGHVKSVQALKTKVEISRSAPPAGTKSSGLPLNQEFSRVPTQTTDSSPHQPGGGRIPQTHSYWSFVPENIKEMEKKNRIASGRDRKWERERFDPTRYRDLCDAALAEL